MKRSLLRLVTKKRERQLKLELAFKAQLRLQPGLNINGLSWTRRPHIETDNLGRPNSRV